MVEHQQQPLSFRSDGTFTIVQFTDVHWRDGAEKDRQTRAIMEAVLRAESPDLVVFTGDVINAKPEADHAAMLRQAVAAVEESGIPWALVFGNHDTEAGITREQLMEAVLEHRHTLTRKGPESVSGTGNYVLSVNDSSGRCAAALIFFDSGDRSGLQQVDGYDWIKRDQIAWYIAQSGDLARANADQPVPALAFFHIPFPEYDEVWRNGACFGNRGESVCAPKINTGLFAAMVERGDVIGTFCGHDHLNDYWGELHGIRLCYGRVTGKNTYPREGDFARGARVIRLYEGERRFDSWIRYGSGEAGYDMPRQPE